MRPELTDAEKVIMDFLWENPQGVSFADIMAHVNENREKALAKQTINTFLSHMIDKGLAEKAKCDKKHIYHATCTITEYRKQEAQYMLDQYYDGSLNAFVSALAGGEKLTEQEKSMLLAMLKEK